MIMRYSFLFLAVSLWTIASGAANFDLKSLAFPEGFEFGVSTAAYQIEGAWNVSDKGESIWDNLTHRSPELIIDGSNGDVACDSYNLYKRDVEMLVELGVDFYRFSISWPRLLPNGFADKVSKDGLRYYNALIDELLAHNIKPVVTLYHWDLPQALQDLGGWANPILADYFEDYADVAFANFGDRVKTWLTFNEPQVYCVQGYGGTRKAPAINKPGIGEYLCGHTTLRAHAQAYHLYNRVYKEKQKGRVGLTMSSSFKQAFSNSDEDIEATERMEQFELGWFAHPIYSKTGDYPPLMKERIANASREQGLKRSRLPEFTQKEIEAIRGSFDFFGLNHYTTFFTKAPNKTIEPVPSFFSDANVETLYDPSWPSAASKWLKVVPWGFRGMLNWIKDRYDNPEVIIYECGYSDKGGIDDLARVDYLRGYLQNLLAAIKDGCKVTGFSAWSLMDNMEWMEGYTERFGLYYVHYDRPDKKREPKKSAEYYKHVIKSKVAL